MTTTVDTPNSEPTTPPARVTVTDIDMPFWSMVSFMVKLSFAAIPAAVVLFLVWALLAGILVGVTGVTSGLSGL